MDDEQFYEGYEEEYEEADIPGEILFEYEFVGPGWLEYEEWEAPSPFGGGFSSIAGLFPMLAILVSMLGLLLFLNLIVRDVNPLRVGEAGQAQQPAAVVAEASEGNGRAGLAPLFTPSVRHWQPQILRWAGEWGLEPNLIATVMQIESCGDPKAVSASGAMGLFQVMPFHFTETEDPYRPNTNALRGMAYLARSLKHFGGDVRLALAGYNAGIAGASRGEANWPQETVRYTRWGVGIYQDAMAGKSESETLAEWLAKGGANLCRAAENRLDIQN